MINDDPFPIALIHPSRSRVEKCVQTDDKWFAMADDISRLYLYVSIDNDDPQWNEYMDHYDSHIITGPNRSSVEAINRAAKESDENILIVISDDTDCFKGWDTALLKAVEGKTDWILKTQDGIQSYIITMPVMDRAYFNRTDTIYHPGFEHLFSDTYLTCLADINGRSITSNLVFPHRHYSHSGGKEGPDELHKRNDATWQQGESLFIKLMKEFTPQQRSLIKDQGMKNWLRNKGVV